MQRFIHIGYPKCASTSLQYFYFDQHPEVYHLGWGYASGPSAWRSEALAAAFEVDLRMAKTLQYDPKVMHAALEPHFKLAAEGPQKAIGVSWESLCFTLVYDVDVALKAARLFHAFGKGTKIVALVRNQLDLIRSMYFEMVRGGMAKTFSEYLEFLYYWRFTGMTTDLLYDQVLGLFANVFGAENMLVLPSEHLMADAPSQLSRISRFLGVSDTAHSLGRLNATEDRRILERVRQLNAASSHGPGAPLFSHLYPQKLTAYWSREGLEFPEAAKVALSMRDRHFAQAEQEVGPDSPELDAAFSPEWESRFRSFYAESNRRTMQRWGLDLAGLGYPVG